MPPPKFVCSSTTGSPPSPRSRRTAFSSRFAEPLGEERPPEELVRVAVLVVGLVAPDLVEVGRELGLLVLAGRDVADAA